MTGVFSLFLVTVKLNKIQPWEVSTRKTKSVVRKKFFLITNEIESQRLTY